MGRRRTTYSANKKCRARARHAPAANDSHATRGEKSRLFFFGVSISSWKTERYKRNSIHDDSPFHSTQRNLALDLARKKGRQIRPPPALPHARAEQPGFSSAESNRRERHPAQRTRRGRRNGRLKRDASAASRSGDRRASLGRRARPREHGVVVVVVVTATAVRRVLADVGVHIGHERLDRTREDHLCADSRSPNRTCRLC